MTLSPLLLPLLAWRRARNARRFFAVGPGPRFHGVYPTREAAVAAILPPKAVGYDHDEVTELNFDAMCRVAAWDGPVLRALAERLPQQGPVLDLGGHMGTKYRAFRPHLPALERVRWTVWDLPAMVAAGEARARAEGIDALRFTSDLAGLDAPHGLLLASGLLQYLDVTFESLVDALAVPPRTIVLNKVAVCEGRTFVTLENLEHSAVPYQVRDERALLEPLEARGYRAVARWEIPALSHQIPHHPDVPPTHSIGLVLERD